MLTYDEESWKPSPEDQSTSKDFPVECRSSEFRQSKTKRVKNYLKKCKSVLGKSGTSDNGSGRGSPAWYVDDEVISCRLQEGEVLEIEDVFESVQLLSNLDCDFSEICQVANVVNVGGKSENAETRDIECDGEEQCDSSVFLPTEQENIAGANAAKSEEVLKDEVEVSGAYVSVL